MASDRREGGIDDAPDRSDHRARRRAGGRSVYERRDETAGGAGEHDTAARRGQPTDRERLATCGPGRPAVLSPDEDHEPPLPGLVAEVCAPAGARRGETVPHRGDLAARDTGHRVAGTEGRDARQCNAFLDGRIEEI